MEKKDLFRGKSAGCKRCRSPLLKHGLARRPEYPCWVQMRHRCRNPNATGYKHYGGRGITVYEGWSDFVRFLVDVGPRPSPTHTLERLDNNGNYEPGNVVWATMHIQRRNTRVNHVLTYRELTLTITDWAIRSGLCRQTLNKRLRNGWGIERALTEPVHVKQRRFTRVGLGN